MNSHALFVVSTQQGYIMQRPCDCFFALLIYSKLLVRQVLSVKMFSRRVVDLGDD